MIGSYTAGSYTDAQAAAVAKLMQATGAAAQMSYGPSESSASPVVQWQAIYTYLGYSKSVAYNDRSWYGLYDWEDLIYNTLKNDGPAILGGQSGTGGHSFVCDGYQADGYFHINWGWAGMSDGYFLLTALNPASQGTGGSEGGYNFQQDAITGIRPPSGDDAVNYQMSASNIQLGNGSNRQLQLNYTWSNYSSATLNNVKIGVRIDGKDYWINSNIASMNPTQGLSFQNLVTVSLSGIDAGTYKAYPVYKCDEVPAGALMKTNISTEPYINLTIDDEGKVTASMPTASITVGAFTFDTQFYIGQQFSFSAKITNNGSLEYASPVTAILIPSGSTEATELSEYALDLMPGESETATFTGTISSSLAAGTYQLYLANVSSDGEVTLLSDPTNVTLVQGAAPMISITSVTIESADAVDPENIKITYTVTNAGGPFAGSFNVYVFPWPGGNNVASFPTPIISVPANSNSGVTFSMTGKFPQATPATKYFLVFYYGNSAASQQINFTTAQVTGIESVVADTPAEVTAIYNMSGQLMPATDPASLAPGLYILVTPQGPVKYLAR